VISVTQEDQDAIIGRLVRERAEKDATIGAIRAELYRIGQSMLALGTMLANDPEHVVFEEQPVDINYTRRGFPIFQPADFNTERLKKLTNDLRTNLQELEHMNQHARQMRVG
jgi:hypothetical protein